MVGKKREMGKSKIKVSGVGKIGAARKKKNRATVIALFAGVGVLTLLLVYLIVQNFGFFENAQPERFIIKDECAVIMGSLVHQIRDEGECRIKCVNECDVREMGFVEFGFEGKNDDCNACDCWCG